MQSVDLSEIAEILDQTDWRRRSLDVVHQTLVEVAVRLNIAIEVRMQEPEKASPVRMLLMERRRPRSAATYMYVTQSEKEYVCHTQHAADRYDTPCAQTSALVCFMLGIILPRDMPTRVSNSVKWKLIQARGLEEAKAIISVAVQAAKGSLARRATATEIAELLDKRFTTDPTHMSDLTLVRSLENTAEIIKNEFTRPTARRGSVKTVPTPGRPTNVLLFRFGLSFLIQLAISLTASVLLYLLNARHYASLAVTLHNVWPLLWRAQPYMDATGHHQMYLYMAAVYLKDLILFALFLAVNVWLLARSGYSLNFRKPKRLLFTIMPLMFCYVVIVLVAGTARIPDLSFRPNTVFDGGLFFGLFLMTWAAPFSLLVLFAWLADQCFDRPLIGGFRLAEATAVASTRFSGDQNSN